MYAASQVGVHAAGGAHQIAVPWIGGSMLGASPATVAVSRAGYEEYGYRIVQEALTNMMINSPVPPLTTVVAVVVVPVVFR